MIKTALSASLIALAVLAPVASAAPAPKEKQPKESKHQQLLDEKTAKYCADIAATKPDKKGLVTLTKEQLAFQAKFDCSAEEPQDCQYADTGSDKGSFFKQPSKPECSLDKLGKTDKTDKTEKPEKPFDPSVIGSDKRVI
jgi:hypothetical protein